MSCIMRWYARRSDAAEATLELGFGHELRQVGDLRHQIGLLDSGGDPLLQLARARRPIAVASLAEPRARAVRRDIVEAEAAAAPRIVHLAVKTDRVGQRSAGMGRERRRNAEVLRRIRAAVERHRSRHRARPVFRAGHDRRESLAVDVEREHDDDRAALGLRIGGALDGEPHQRREQIVDRQAARRRGVARHLHESLLVDLEPLALRGREQNVAQAGRQIVAPLVDDPHAAVGDAHAADRVGGDLVLPRSGRGSCIARASAQSASTPGTGRRPMRNSSTAGRPAGLAQQRLHVHVAPERVRRHLDARRERQHAGTEHEPRAALAEPVGEIVDDEIELVGADRHRAQRAALHPSRIVLLENPHGALDVVRA